MGTHKAGLIRRENTFRKRRNGKNPWVARKRLALVVIACLFLVGCFGPVPPRSSDVMGTVKLIDTPTTSLTGNEQPSSKGVGSAPTLSPLSRGASGRTYGGVGASPRFEYILEVRPWENEGTFLGQLAAYGFRSLRHTGHGRIYVVVDEYRRSTYRAMEALARLESIVSVTPNRAIELLQISDGGGDGDVPWALHMIRATEAWDYTGGYGEHMTVAIIDTGVDFTHPAFEDTDMWVEGRDFVTPSAGDNPVAGVPYGPDFSDGHSEVHGTRVAGIVAARGALGQAPMVGVAPKARIMPVRVIEEGAPSGSLDALIQALHWVVEADDEHPPVDVINMSVGYRLSPGARCDEAVESLLRRAEAKGIVVVAAAGNDGGAALYCPAAYDTVVATGAVTAEGERAPYSNFGKGLDLVAPGGGDRPRWVANTAWSLCQESVISPVAAGGYDCPLPGTSFAAPHVSGVVALMLAEGRVATPGDVRALLHMTAKDLVGLRQWDTYTGYGLVDAAAAVRATVPRVMAVRTDSAFSSWMNVNGRNTDEGVRPRPVETVAGPGGAFRLRGLSEGTWTIYVWADNDGSGTLNEGDYYGEYGPIVVSSSRATITDVHIDATVYSGDERTFF